MNGILTPQERASALRMGMYLGFADKGVNPSQIDAFVKSAEGAAAASWLSPTGLAKAVIAVSVLAGVPLGIAAHVVGRHVRDARGRESELKAQTGYYRNAAQQLETGLAASGATA